jgi:hypothetical protein
MIMNKSCKKVSFSDEKTALYYIDKLKRTSVRTIVPHRAYLCEKCFCWHLTSRLSAEERQAKKDKAEREGVFENKVIKEAVKSENLALKRRVTQLEKESANKTKKINELHEQIYELNKASGRFKKTEN